MVKKYFRKYIISVCLAFSAVSIAGAAVPTAMIYAAETTDNTNGESENGEEWNIEDNSNDNSNPTDTTDPTVESNPTDTTDSTDDPDTTDTTVPTDSTDTTDSTDPTDSADTTDTTDQTDSTDTTDTTDPTDSTDPTDTTDPTDDPDTTDTTDPTDDPDTTDTTDPTDSTDPTDTTDPTDDPDTTDTTDPTDDPDTTDTQDPTEESESEEKEEKYTGAELTYDKSSYQAGEDIIATVSGISGNMITKAVATYIFPENISLKDINTMPDFSGCSKITFEYMNEEGIWGEITSEVNAESVRGIRYSAETATTTEEDKTVLEELIQTSPLTLVLTGNTYVNTSSAVTTLLTKEDGTEITTESRSQLLVEDEGVTISFNQTPEAPTKEDKIKQSASVKYYVSSDSKITYKIDPALTLESIDMNGESYLVGGKAIITSEAGENEVEISSVMDFSDYTGITSVVFIPKVKSMDGTEAVFTATLSVNKNVETTTCSVNVYAQDGDRIIDETETVSAPIAFCDLAKPEFIYSNEQVPFDVDFSIGFRGFAMKSYGENDDYVYSIGTPDFVKIKSLVLPSVNGADKIKVTLTVNGEESSKEYKPGDVVEINAYGVSKITLTATPTSDLMEATSEGGIVMINDDRENKANYYGFSAEASTKIGEATYKSSSNVLGVTFAVYKATEPVEPQTNEPSQPEPVNPGGGGSTPGGGGGGGTTPSVEPASEQEPETEDPRIEEEKRRKEEINKEALRREQEMKDRQKAILEGRVNDIRSGISGTASSGTGSGSGSSSGRASSGSSNSSVKTPSKVQTDKGEELDISAWKIKPIREAIIKDRTASKIKPIRDTIVDTIVRQLPRS